MAAPQAVLRLWRLPVQVGVVHLPPGHPKRAVPRVVLRPWKLPVQVVVPRRVEPRPVAVALCST